MKEKHATRPNGLLDLGNGTTRVYYNTVGNDNDGYTSDYVDVVDASYDCIVDAIISTRYSPSNEIAILRQKEVKPEEYKSYYEYCEECKKVVINLNIQGIK